MKRSLLSITLLIASLGLKAQVGIGTTTPRGALEVYSTTNGFVAPQVALTSTTLSAPVVNPQGNGTTIPYTPISGTIVYNTATTGDVTPGYYYWDSTNKWVRFSPTTSTSNWALLGNAGTVPGTHFIGTTDNVDFVTKSNNVERTRITTAGAMGIGTSTPNGALEITSGSSNNLGMIPPQVALTSTTTSTPVVNARGGAFSIVAGTIVYNTNTAGTAPTNVTPGYYYWDSTAWKKLSVDSWSIYGNKGTSASTNFVGTSDNVDFVTRTNNTEKMRVTSGGNVGIGTSSPTTLLHLKNGHIRSEQTTKPTGSGDIGTVTLSTDSTNTKGKISATTPLITLGGSTITITFTGNDTPFSIAPTVVVTPANSATGSKNYYISNTSTTSFSITISSTIALNTTYEFNYIVIE